MRNFKTWAAECADVKGRALQLGIELQEKWNDWQGVSGYASIDDCLQAHLGFGADALKMRKYRASKKADTKVTAPLPASSTPVDEEDPYDEEGWAKPVGSRIAAHVSSGGGTRGGRLPATKQQVEEIKRRRADGGTIRQIAADMKIHQSKVAPVVNPEAHSVIHEDAANPLVCAADPPADLIKAINFYAGEILNKERYTLGVSDLNKLERTFVKWLKETRHQLEERS